ncbi:MAG: ferredoxin [Rhodobacteraceae bacterium]|nr:ferredoxin [Paracoccaceae bacterium]
MDFDHLEESAQARGLMVRGGFHPAPEDGVPPIADGRAAGTVVLLGSAGGSLWGHFSAAPEALLAEHPLDAWTRRVAGGLAEEMGATALFPFGGPPYLPFQRWAKRAEPVHTSPLGLLIHPEYGLWHAYRAALAFSTRIALPPQRTSPSPCAACPDRPCLAACPVGAFTSAGYDVPGCAAHISADAGSECMARSCLARRACPVGRDYTYGPEQARFHMTAFRRARQPAQRRGAVPDRA